LSWCGPIYSPFFDLLGAERDGLGRDTVLPPPLDTMPKRCTFMDSNGNKRQV
jgi:hypothetical protein